MMTYIHSSLLKASCGVFLNSWLKDLPIDEEVVVIWKGEVVIQGELITYRPGTDYYQVQSEDGRMLGGNIRGRTIVPVWMYRSKLWRVLE